jgi:hypothetical protein
VIPRPKFTCKIRRTKRESQVKFWLGVALLRPLHSPLCDNRVFRLKKTGKRYEQEGGITVGRPSETLREARALFTEVEKAQGLPEHEEMVG